MDFIRGFANGALLGAFTGMCGWGMPWGGFAFPPMSIWGFPMGGGCGCCHNTSIWFLC